MEIVTLYLKKVNWILVSFLAYAGRLVLFGGDFADAAILFVLASLYGVLYYINEHKENKVEKEFKQKVQLELNDIRSSIATTRLGSGLKR